MTLIETERLLIRRITVEDLDHVVDLHIQPGGVGRGGGGTFEVRR